MRATGHIRSAIALATLLLAPSLLYSETIEFAPYHGHAMDSERQPIALAEDLELALDLDPDTEAMAIMNELDREEAFYVETFRQLEARVKKKKQTWGVRVDHTERMARQYQIERLHMEATAYATTELARLTREENHMQAIRIAILEKHRKKRSSDLRPTNNGNGPALAATESNAAINTSSGSRLAISGNRDYAGPHVADGDSGVRHTQAVDAVVQTSYFSIRNGYVRRWARTQTNNPTTTRTKRKATRAIVHPDGFSPSVVHNLQDGTANSITRKPEHLVAYEHCHAGAAITNAHRDAITPPAVRNPQSITINSITRKHGPVAYAHGYVPSIGAMRAQSSGLDIQSTEVKCELLGERGSFQQSIADNSSKQTEQAHGFLVAYTHVHADGPKSKI